MKKLLSLLGTVTLIATSTTTVIACGTKSENKPEEPKEDLNEIIKDFQEEATNIYIEHMKNEVNQNLIGIQENEKKYLFIKKDNIKLFSNKAKELTLKDKKDIDHDENIILSSKILAEKLNELKKINKYKIILDDIDSLFDGVEIIYNDNFEIKSGELSEGVYIGNFINEYKINIKYKGKYSFEKFELKDILKYTSTDSEAFKKDGEEIQEKIAKNFFLSNEVKDFSNFNWSEIKDSKQDWESFGDYSENIKKYVNSNNNYSQSLINFIKKNYFKKFQNLNINFNKKSIYKEGTFKNNFLTAFENKNPKDFNNFSNSKEESKKMFELIFRKDINSQESKQILNNIYLTSSNKQEWLKEWDQLKDNYFKEMKFNNEEINAIKKLDSYKSSIANFKLKITGLSIKFGDNENAYIHELPDFNLISSYSYNSKQTDINWDLLNELILKNIVKNIQDFYGIDTSFKYPDFYSNDNYLFNLKNKELVNIFKNETTSNNDKYSISVLNMILSGNSTGSWYLERSKSLKDLMDKLNFSHFINKEYYEKREYYFNLNSLVTIYNTKTTGTSSALYEKNNDIINFNRNSISLKKNDLLKYLTFAMGYLKFSIDIGNLLINKNGDIKEIIKFIE
ncbi:lipoprotein [Spiroplasma endosymbiont of Atherix ibis]|uniref:lipoprotein n=1 Tax=Spiroplasma endosymbiont of Atherix ibis TaxID=3066291 RepID=UPI0030CC9FB9